MDHDSGVAERKGLLNRRCLLGSWYNKTMDHDSGVAERKGLLNRRCLLRRKTAHAVFYRKKHKFCNRIC